ncbi:MAG: diguanylate cyclase, partial [Actinomycetota bacterium]
DAAIVWRFSPTRDEVQPQIGRELEVEKLRSLPVGTGIAGLVAERGVRILKSSGTEGPLAAAGEPDLPVVIATPLYSQDRIQGVLSLYRRGVDTPFTREDLETVVFLAEQGGVAIENVLLHEEAQRLSLMDGLTGVWNRRFFQMQFRQMLATALRFERPFSVLMLDLDRFKDVNDTHGHQRGDAILVEFAQRVSRTLREVDTFARYGGEEFICLLYETDITGAIPAAEKILETIRRESFGGVGEDSVQLTVSIGIAAFPKHGDSFASLVEAADQALYKAKQSGRDRVEIADEPPAGLRVAK